MNTAVIAVTDRGRRLAEKIAAGLCDSVVLDQSRGLSAVLAERWHRHEGFVFVMAVGAAVRLIAPCLRDKYTDPCVVAVDEKGCFAVSLVSGHIGGGNRLAGEIAMITGGQAVITTASDILGHTAVDLWARNNDFFPEDRAALTRVSAKLVNNGKVCFFSDIPIHDIPHDFERTEDHSIADIIVSHRIFKWPENSLILRPRIIVIGIGCNRGVRSEQIEQAFSEAFMIHGFSEKSALKLASIDLKRNEKGLLEFAVKRGLDIDFFTAGQLNSVKDIEPSDAVMKATGAKAVAEPSALLGAGNNKLLTGKMKWKDVTIAAAMALSI